MSFAQSDTDRALIAATLATCDTGEWDDTDPEVEAQDPPSTSPQMFEDTGVVIISRPASDPASTDNLVVTFREPSSVTFREPSQRAPSPRSEARASTAGDWPPTPREPAVKVPLIRERALRNAGIYTVVTHPETKN